MWRPATAGVQSRGRKSEVALRIFLLVSMPVQIRPPASSSVAFIGEKSCSPCIPNIIPLTRMYQAE